MRKLLITALLFSTAALGQTPTKDEIDLQKAEQDLAKAKLDNEKLALDIAEKERALDEAKRKAIVDAIPSGDTTGKIDVKEGAGVLEANAMAALAVSAIADDIAQATVAAVASAGDGSSSRGLLPCAVLPTLASGTPAAAAGDRESTAIPVLLLGSTEALTFARWEQFRFNACTIASSLKKTIEALPAKASATAETGGGVFAAATALQVASKLAKLITPDWEVGGVAANSTDRALLAAVAEEFLSSNTAKTGALYWANQVSRIGGADGIFSALLALEGLDIKASAALATLAPALAEAQAHYDKVMADKKSTTAAKKTAKEALEKLSKPIGAVKEAQGDYAALVASLDSKAGETNSPLSQIIHQAATAQLLGEKGLVLTVNVQSAGGGYYTRRAIWNAFAISSPPHFVSGGVIANYAVIRASDQRVLAAGLVRCSAGYSRISKVSTKVNRGQAPELVCGRQMNEGAAELEHKQSASDARTAAK